MMYFKPRDTAFQGTEDLILAARPGGKRPLLLAGATCFSGATWLQVKTAGEDFIPT